jgi:hypothetical protein
MDFSKVVGFFQHFETGRVLRTLQDLDLGRLVHNPWLLGGVGALALIALFMRWRVLLTTLLGVTGFVWLIAHTLKKGTDINSLGSGSLVTFVGGGVVIILVVIYFLFIRSD